ncbi:MAG: hypothetical protein WBK42_09410 [Dethiobacteria bacterium]
MQDNAKMRIFNLKTTCNNSHIKLSVSIESKHLGLKELWFSTPVEYAYGLCKTRLDGFLVGMLYPAMQYGEDIQVEGCVSKKLLFNLNNYVIPLLMTFSPSIKQIKITAEETSAERFDCYGIGTGFSGGIDSFCTIYDRYELETDPDYKINSFLFLNVGSHGPFDEAKTKSKFLNRYNYLKAFPKKLGLEFIPLDSNLHLFHPWGHQKTHTLTSAAGVLLMQQWFKRYYYASSGDYQEIINNGYKFKEIGIGMYCDPIILPLLSTESLEFISDGVQYTRTEKLLKILNYEPVYRYLNVCVSGDENHNNCSVCSKCCRTLMALNSLGKLDEFSQLFDIEKYKKKAELKYVCEQVLSQKRDPFARGNIELARQMGVSLPPVIICYAVCASDILRTFLIKLVKTILPPKVIDKLKEIISH